VLAWRSEKHPDFTLIELEAQWTRHYQHHAGKGNLAIDWVLSFYNWLTGPYYVPATGPDAGGKSKLAPESFDERRDRLIFDRLEGLK